MPHDMTAPQILLETPADQAAADALIERAFGPGRLVKVSERVREIARFRPDLSFAAFQGDVLTGSVRLWDIAVGGAPPTAMSHRRTLPVRTSP